MTSMLPPSFAEETLPLALDAFRSALGPEAVITAEDELRDFRDPFAFAAWDDYTASAVLMPETVEQIQAIVRIANEHRVPLWTHAHRDEQRLRRAGAAPSGLRDREPPADEPRARDQRGQRLRRRRAGRPLVRPVRRGPGRAATS